MNSEATFAPLNPHGAILGDEVYSVLGHAILDGTLEPGERLRDVELATRLGISRTPVREALQRLERIGMVEVAANRWTRVSVPNERLLADTHEFVAYVMGNALRMALPRCTDEQLETAVGLVDAIADASRADDVMGIMHRSARFFQFLTVATHNVVFLTVLREADLALRRNLTGWRPLSSDAEERTLGYVALRDAVATRDATAAEAILRAQHGFS